VGGDFTVVVAGGLGAKEEGKPLLIIARLVIYHLGSADIVFMSGVV